MPKGQTATQSLSYNYSVPYSGGAKLTVINNSNQAVRLQSLEFTTNTKIDSNPWGTLWGWGANMTVTTTPDQQAFTYTIIEPAAGIIIPANEQAELSYTVGGAAGVLPLAMDPSTVKVSVDNQNNIALNIAGACPECPDPTPGKSSGGYFTNWSIYAGGYSLDKIPVDKLNTINYAFLGLERGKDGKPNGDITLLDPNADDKLLPGISMLRKKFPYLRALLAFGGWTNAGERMDIPFSQLAADPIARQKFVNNAIAAMKQLGFDGIKIDWEYPDTRPEDASNFALLMSELRAALDKQAKIDGVSRYYLGIAAPAGIDKIQIIKKNDPNAWKAVAAAVDQVDLMTYDFHGAFDKPGPTSHQSAMTTSPQDPYYQNPVSRHYNVEDAVAAYLEIGFKSEQLLVGIPAYSRNSVVASNTNNGLYQNITDAGQGQFEAGVSGYACVVANDCQQGNRLPNGTQFFWDETAQVPYAFNPTTQTFYTFDNANSTQIKTAFVQQKQLGGAFTWDLSTDLSGNNPNSLIATMQRGLNPSKQTSHTTQTATSTSTCTVYQPLGGKTVTHCGEVSIVSDAPNFEDNYAVDQCKPVGETMQCQGENSTLIVHHQATATHTFFQNLDGNIALAAVTAHGIGKFVTAVKNWLAPEKEISLPEKDNYLAKLHSEIEQLELQLKTIAERIKQTNNRSQKVWLNKLLAETKFTLVDLKEKLATALQSKQLLTPSLQAEINQDLAEVKHDSTELYLKLSLTGKHKNHNLQNLRATLNQTYKAVHTLEKSTQQNQQVIAVIKNHLKLINTEFQAIETGVKSFTEGDYQDLMQRMNHYQNGLLDSKSFNSVMHPISKAQTAPIGRGCLFHVSHVAPATTTQQPAALPKAPSVAVVCTK